jgi:hypothetical protein
LGRRWFVDGKAVRWSTTTVEGPYSTEGRGEGEGQNESVEKTLGGGAHREADNGGGGISKTGVDGSAPITDGDVTMNTPEEREEHVMHYPK